MELSELSKWVSDASEKSMELIKDLNDDELSVPYISTINPFIWELCHSAYFLEFWVLRKGLNRKPIISNADSLFDSMKIGHESRWKLKIPNKEESFEYLINVKNSILDLLKSKKISDKIRYYIIYSVMHLDMHTEAFTYVRQSLGYPDPNMNNIKKTKIKNNYDEFVEEDVIIPSGTYKLGASKTSQFIFDNEKWSHEIEVEKFKISKTAVTEGQFLEFVNDGGYNKPELWSKNGWKWLNSVQKQAPHYWRKEKNEWEKRLFDKWFTIQKNIAMCHVNWYEADAYCKWSKRRLPTEIEWEIAASYQFKSNKKRNYPWGNLDPDMDHANMDWQNMEPVDVRAYSKGDSAIGCRQMIGNVWEWTDTTFEPYPGFIPDMYKDYSQSSFGTRKVLRGGCWATRSRLIRNTLRNFYTPNRNDVFAGFRTCALTI